MADEISCPKCDRKYLKTKLPDECPCGLDLKGYFDGLQTKESKESTPNYLDQITQGQMTFSS